VTYIPKSSIKSQPTQQPTWTIENRNVWDFFSKKKRFLAPKTKKFAGATVEFKGIPGIPTISFQSTLYSQNGPSTNISNLESRDISTHEGETEQTNLPLWSRAKIRNIFGNTCECKLPVRQCTELAYDPKSPDLADWAELQRCNLQGVCTFLLPLALRRAAVLSDCIFPLCLLWVLEDTRTYDSKQPFSRQTEIHPEICENCRCAFLYNFCVALRVEFLLKTESG